MFSAFLTKLVFLNSIYIFFFFVLLLIGNLKNYLIFFSSYNLNDLCYLIQIRFLIILPLTDVEL